MANKLAAVEQVQSTVIDLALKFGPRLLVAILIAVIGYFVARGAERVVARLLSRMQIDVTVRQLLARAVLILVLGLFVVMALQNLGIEILPLIAGLGIAGAGVALAMQGVLGNLVAGFTIIFTRPFVVGEYISIAGEEGTVELINLFNTVLLHPDMSRVVIPNRKVAGEILHNYGTLRQLDLGVNVIYGVDISKTLEVLQDIVTSSPHVLKTPKPVLQVANLADSSARISIRPWVLVGDYVTANGELNLAIVETFAQRGIEIPPPRRDIRMLA